MTSAARRRLSVAMVFASACALVLCPSQPANAEDGDPASYFGVDGYVYDDGALTAGGTSTGPPTFLDFPHSFVTAATDDAEGNIYLAFSGVVAGVVKYFFEGERDLSFGEDGVFTFVGGAPDSTTASIRDIVAREDGTIVVGGDFLISGPGIQSPTYAIINASGSAATFPDGPPVFFPNPYQRGVSSLVLLPDDRVVLGGVTQAGLGIRVLEPNGSVWQPFVLPNDPVNAPASVRDVIVLADGHLLVQIYYTNENLCRTYALTPAFVVDPAFDSDGVISHAGQCGEIAADPNGSWLLTRINALYRYSVTGELLDFDVVGYVFRLGVDGTGRILLSDANSVRALYPDFTADDTFGELGTTVLDVYGEGMLVMFSGDLLFYRGNSMTSIEMQVLEDPYGVAPQPWALGMGAFVPMVPDRVLDTRFGTGAPLGFVAGGASIDVQIAGFKDVPSDGSAIAVVLNVTSVHSSAKGFVTVWPTGGVRPTVSSLNYLSNGAAVPNMVTVAMGEGGRVSLYTSASANLIADVLGYYRATDVQVAAGRFQLLKPERVVDTREGLGAPEAPVAPEGELVVQLTGVAGIPTTGVSAVAFNLTATRTLSNGHLTAYPTGATRPGTSNVNVLAGGTRANFVILPVSADGQVTIYSKAGGDVLVDVVGWFTDDTADLRYDGLFVPISPRRIVDTRYGVAAARARNSVLVKQLGSTSVGPAYRIIGAAVLNLTVVSPQQSGWISVWPTGIPKPKVSSVNVGSDQAHTANAAIVGLGVLDNGGFQVEFQTVSHLVVDMAGYYVAYSN